MTDSTNTNLTHLLLQDGFKCKRQYYTPDVTKKGLKIRLNSDYFIHPSNVNNKNYPVLCYLLYQYYQEMHQAVSPLTVSKDILAKEVPTRTGCCSTNKDEKTENFVFTEKNEIAYICSFNKKSCNLFIEATLSEMFSKYSSIFFEVDDTDWAAIKLFDHFNINEENSPNTHIYTWKKPSPSDPHRVE